MVFSCVHGSHFASCQQGVESSFPGTYRLVSQFPRREIEADNRTIGDLGLTGSQEVLFVEPKNSDE